MTRSTKKDTKEIAPHEEETFGEIPEDDPFPPALERLVAAITARIGDRR